MKSIRAALVRIHELLRAMNKFLSLLFVFLSVLSLVVVSGCALAPHGRLHPDKSVSIPKPNPSAHVVQSGSAVANIDSGVPAHIGDAALNEIRTLIGAADAACTKGQFFQANVAVSEAINMINANQAVSDSVSTNLDTLYESIVSIYMKLPAEFLETLPEELAPIIFQKRLVQAIDSIVVSEADSISLSRMMNQKGIHYDIPLVWNSRVLKSLIYFSRGRKGPVGVWLDRAATYVPVMRPLFAEAGIPQDLVYLPLIESGFSSKAYSYAHASGIWQFIPGTGKRYGLRINYWLDERRDPYKATKAAISYLKTLYDEFGDWYLALAAYNCGEGNMRKAIQRKGTNDFWQLSLPRETKDYVPQFIAALIVAKNPRCFGFSPPEEKALIFDTAQVSVCVDLQMIADSLGVPLDTLQNANPHIMRWCTPPDAQNVALFLPRGIKPRFDSLIAAIPEDKKIRWFEYKVHRGETMASIARQFKVPVDAIRSLNGNSVKRLIAGKSVFLPLKSTSALAQSSVVETSPPIASSKEYGPREATLGTLKTIAYKIRPHDTMSALALLFKTSVSAICQENGFSRQSPLVVGRTIKIPGTSFDASAVAPVAKKTPARVTDSDIQYKVAAGDNLSSIAQMFGTSVESICDRNGLSVSETIQAGDVIRVHPITDRQKAEQNQTIVLYTVRSGDNLWSIAQTFKVPVESLYQANGLKKDSVLIPGNKLKIVASVEGL